MMEKRMAIPDPILIVEDDPDDQYFLKNVFKDMGVTADLVFRENGIEALDYLSTTKRKTFIILCDINMPVMDGLELRKTINQNEKLRKKSIPFVYMSTAARKSDVEQAYDLTVQGFFVKEAQLSEMEKTLSLILGYWLRCKHPNSVK
jgi:CheY-like chemotaxis protein